MTTRAFPDFCLEDLNSRKQGFAALPSLFFGGGGRFGPSRHVFKPKDKAMRLEQLLEAATAREATMEQSLKVLVPKNAKQKYLDDI